MTQSNSIQHSQAVQSLFKPFKLGKLSIPNRIVMAPMTRGFSPEGIPGQNVADYYRRRAEGGVGLIITEGTLINHPASASSPNYPSFYGEKALKGWSEVVASVHAAGGLIFPQLWHEGTTRKIGALPNIDVMPVGPSGITSAGVKVNEPLSETEIASIVQAFAQAAADAQSIGFDGIEIHGAHGYLIDEFFWDKTNLRTDKYGGDLVSRTRFAAEIIAACRLAVGPDFPICLRISQWKEATYWDGSNHIGRITGSQWHSQTLYLSSKGQYYIIEDTSYQSDKYPKINLLSKEEAASWLLLNEHELPEDLKEYEDELVE